MNAEELYRKLRLKQVPELIFLYGQEPYLVQRAACSVRQAVLPDEKDDFNDDQFYGKEATAERILEAALTFPVFAPKRLVTIKDAHQLPAAELEKLLPYLQNPVSETCLLFIADKIDNRRKFFQQFKKTGALVEFKSLSEKDIPRYICKFFEQHDMKISEEAVGLFCSMVSGSLYELHAELDKLLIYVGDVRLIDIKDIQTVVSRGRAENIFELGNAVGRGDVARALTLVMRLSSAGEAPLKILALLVRHFRQLWKVRELQVQKYPLKEIAKIAGVPFFVVAGLIQQGKNFSRKDFTRAHELFLETDLAMKSSGADAAALLDNLVLCLVKKNGS